MSRELEWKRKAELYDGQKQRTSEWRKQGERVEKQKKLSWRDQMYLVEKWMD